MSSRHSNQSYYEVLEVSQDAPHHEIVKAYHRAKAAYAPGSAALYSMFTEDEAHALRKLVEEAFFVLSNQQKRLEYDNALTGRGEAVADVHIPAIDSLPDFDPAPPTKTKSQPPKSASVASTLTKPPAPTIPQSQPATQAFTTTTSGAGGVPAGFAKSKLSVYEVKPEVEAEIGDTKVFDGAFLRKVRQYKNIQIDQLSKETRISRTYINAVESDDFEALPAAVFVRGFVVQLARILGLDENLAAASYMEKMKSAGK